MTDKIDTELRDQLAAVLSAGVDDETMKGVKKALDDIAYNIEDALMYSLKDNLAHNLSCWVADMAQRAVERMLEGDEIQMRRYLSCEKRGEDGEYIGWTGRSDGKYFGRQREAHEWHSVIHGRLFEQGAVELRRKIVDAHRDLLVSERIKDLEDQVASLVEQVNRANAEKERMWQRVRELQPA